MLPCWFISLLPTCFHLFILLPVQLMGRMGNQVAPDAKFKIAVPSDKPLTLEDYNDVVPFKARL